MTLSWRLDAPPNLVKLAVGRCLIAVMDRGKWTELGLLTDTTELIENHPRLLRSLHFGDDDYEGHVLGVVPELLDERAEPAPDPWGGAAQAVPAPLSLYERFPKLEAVAEYLTLPVWLAEHENKLFERLIGNDETDATMPDGTVLTAAESAAARLGVGEMRRQVDRIRRDHSSDPEAAIGQAKDLIETVCKTVLGTTGESGDAVKFPALVKRTLIHLGIDPTQVAATDAVEARGARQIFGGISNILHGADELRNARGTGHGRSGSPLIDDALARLAVGAVLPAVVYLIEVFEARTGDAPAVIMPPLSLRTRQTVILSVGNIVRHETYGEGQIKALAGQGAKQIADVDFGGEIGVKRLLVQYANLSQVH